MTTNMKNTKTTKITKKTTTSKDQPNIFEKLIDFNKTKKGKAAMKELSEMMSNVK
jgi:hypothetical protein